MGKFYGKTYRYPTPSHGTQTIGVCQGLGGEWIVGYQRPGTVSTKRIKTPHLPVLTDPAELQIKLDLWASVRNLQQVETRERMGVSISGTGRSYPSVEEVPTERDRAPWVFCRDCADTACHCRGAENVGCRAGREGTVA